MLFASDEAISTVSRGDCFGSLAMTGLGGSLAKSLVISLYRTGLEEPVLGTEIGRNLPGTARLRRCRNHVQQGKRAEARTTNGACQITQSLSELAGAYYERSLLYTNLLSGLMGAHRGQAGG